MLRNLLKDAEYFDLNLLERIIRKRLNPVPQITRKAESTKAVIGTSGNTVTYELFAENLEWETL